MALPPRTAVFAVQQWLMKSLCLPAMIAVAVALSAGPASAGMQAEKMLRDVAVNHDLQRIKRNLSSDVHSEFFAPKKTLQQARNLAAEK
jgi:hypothetical protein